MSSLVGALCRRTRTAGILIGVCLAPGCGASGESGDAVRLESLTLEGVELSPSFRPDRTHYRGTASLLHASVRVRARAADSGAAISLARVEGATARGELDLDVDLPVGNTAWVFRIGSEPAVTRYRVELSRGPELWHSIAPLLAEAPRENGYFGDYLQLSPRFAYVNHARRGVLYARTDTHWEWLLDVEVLFPFALDWMFEAALSDAFLLVVARPVDGDETLYAFARAHDTWLPLGGHVVGSQGSVRLHDEDVVFVTAEGSSFFRLEEDGLVLDRQLDAPAADVGFGTRPSYFDAPGVAFDGATLVVGAPLFDAPVLDGQTLGGAGDPCDPAVSDCARDVGVAYVYERDASRGFERVATLYPERPESGLEFGRVVSLRGDTLAVGTALETVCLFRRERGAWQAAGVLTPSVRTQHDYFGDSVLLVGDLLLIGAPGHDAAVGAALDDDGQPDSGGVFAFVEESGGAFRELGVWKPPPSLGVEYPFPDQLRAAGRTLYVPANTATSVGPDGASLPFAGKVYQLN